MSKLTREQANRWNAQAKNGFTFDIEHYVIWNEKGLKKRVPTETGFTQFKLGYNDEIETVTNEYGCKYNRRTGRYVPTLHISEWKPTHTEGVYSSDGLGQFIPVGAPQDKKNYKVLCDISATINVDDYKA